MHLFPDINSCGYWRCFIRRPVLAKSCIQDNTMPTLTNGSMSPTSSCFLTTSFTPHCLHPEFQSCSPKTLGSIPWSSVSYFDGHVRIHRFQRSASAHQTKVLYPFSFLSTPSSAAYPGSAAASDSDQYICASCICHGRLNHTSGDISYLLHQGFLSCDSKPVSLSLLV